MTSLETSGTTTSLRSVDGKAKSADAAPRQTPKARTPAEAPPRCSPDPFIATDRYRLTMPYADHI